MADVTGRLTPEDFAKIQAWWKLHWKEPIVCPICKSGEWTAGTHIVYPPRFAAPESAMNAPTYPVISVMSVPCGYTMYFNAVLIGVAPSYAGTGALDGI